MGSGAAKKILFALLATSALGALLYWGLHKQDFDWRMLGQAIRGARFSLIFLGFLAVYGAFALRAARWRGFCRYVGNPAFGDTYSCTLMGFTALFLLGRAGEPIRPLLIARRSRLSISSQFGVYVLERIFDTGASAVMAGISLLGFAHLVIGPENESLLRNARIAGLMLLAGFGGAVVFLIFFRLRGAAWMKGRFAHWHQRTGWHARVAGMLDGLAEGLQAIRSYRDLLGAMAYSAAHWVLIIAAYQWISASFGGRLAEVDFPQAMLVLVFSMVGSMVQLPAVGGGSQLASFFVFTQLLHVEREPALAASILIWLVTFGACIPVGIPLLVREGFSVGALRRLAEAEKEAEAHGEHLRDVPAPKQEQNSSGQR